MRKRYTKEQREQYNKECLSNAVNNQVLTNYPAIFEYFLAMGIPDTEIRPRENVFTLPAWNALGRKIKKGSKGCKVITMKKSVRLDETTGEEEVKKIFASAYVFHVSQTEEFAH